MVPSRFAATGRCLCFLSRAPATSLDWLCCGASTVSMHAFIYIRMRALRHVTSSTCKHIPSINMHRDIVDRQLSLVFTYNALQWHVMASKAPFSTATTSATSHSSAPPWSCCHVTPSTGISPCLSLQVRHYAMIASFILRVDVDAISLMLMTSLQFS